MVILTVFSFRDSSGERRGSVPFPAAQGRAQSGCEASAASGRAGREQRRQQQRQEEARAGPRSRPARGRAAAAAAARLPLAAQLLAQDARVGRRALAPHVVDAGPAVLAVQELIVTHVRCKIGGRGHRTESQCKFVFSRNSPEPELRLHLPPLPETSDNGLCFFCFFKYSWWGFFFPPKGCILGKTSNSLNTTD